MFGLQSTSGKYDLFGLKSYAYWYAHKEEVFRGLIAQSLLRKGCLIRPKRCVSFDISQEPVFEHRLCFSVNQIQNQFRLSLLEGLI